jgi:spermidine/putrescine transport system substrate-binding protein
MTYDKTLRLAAGVGLAVLLGTAAASAETLRLLTWGGYAPDDVIALFEQENPDIDVEVTISTNEDMIAKLRATGGAGFDLAQPSHDRISAVQQEYGIYKPLDLSKIDTDALNPNLLEGVKANTTIDGANYAVPHVWGTSGLMADVSKAPDFDTWDDICNPEYAGRTSMRLRRTILLGMGFAMGKDPFALYADPAGYQAMLDEVADKLIACKANIKTYWQGQDDLAALMLSGEVVATEAWDQIAFKLYGQNKNIHYIPPATGALAWIDTFALPAKGEADDAAYKWINFVNRPDVASMMAPSAGAIPAAKDGLALLPPDMREAVDVAFDDEDMANLKFFANIPPGIEDMEGKTLDRIQATN